MTFRLKRFTFVLGRSAEGIVPLDALWFLLFPIAVLRAVRDMRTADRDLPVRRLPAGPEDRRPSAAERFRFCLTGNLRRPLPIWGDRFAEPRWQRRITVQGADRLREALAGPVIIGTVHTGSTLVLNMWLRALRVPVGSAAMDARWLTDPTLRKRAFLGTVGEGPFIFPPGSGRQMTRFLVPGHILMMALDYAQGHLVKGTWRGAELRVATGAFRLARRTGATIIPVVAFETGRWRWRIVVGEPIPAVMIADGRHAEAASAFAEQVLPEVARRPFQAVKPLVYAAQPADGSSRTGSGTTEVPVAH